MPFPQKRRLSNFAHSMAVRVGSGALKAAPQLQLMLSCDAAVRGTQVAQTAACSRQNPILPSRPSRVSLSGIRIFASRSTVLHSPSRVRADLFLSKDEKVPRRSLLEFALNLEGRENCPSSSREKHWGPTPTIFEHLACLRAFFQRLWSGTRGRTTTQLARVWPLSKRPDIVHSPILREWAQAKATCAADV